MGAIAGGHARLLALFLALLAGAVLATLLTRWTHRWEELETLAARRLPPPRLRRREARRARIGILICLAPVILLGGHEQDELRAAGTLSLFPLVFYIVVLYWDDGDRDGLVALAHALLGSAAFLADEPPIPRARPTP